MCLAFTARQSRKLSYPVELAFCNGFLQSRISGDRVVLEIDILEVSVCPKYEIISKTIYWSPVLQIHSKFGREVLTFPCIFLKWRSCSGPIRGLFFFSSKPRLCGSASLDAESLPLGNPIGHGVRETNRSFATFSVFPTQWCAPSCIFPSKTGPTLSFIFVFAKSEE